LMPFCLVTLGNDALFPSRFVNYRSFVTGISLLTRNIRL